MITFFQKKIIFMIALGIIILALVFVSVIYPLVNKIADYSYRYLSNKEILSGLSKRESLAKELRNDFQEKQDALSRIEGALLGAEETVGFISTIESIAQETGNLFEIKTASPSLLTSEGEPFLFLSVVLWGDFSELLNFIANIEDSPYPPYRLMEIEGINIKRLLEGDIETNLEIKIYTK